MDKATSLTYQVPICTWVCCLAVWCVPPFVSLLCWYQSTVWSSVSKGSLIHEIVQEPWFVSIVQIAQILVRMAFPLFRQLFQHYVGQVSGQVSVPQEHGLLPTCLLPLFSLYIPSGVSDSKTHPRNPPPLEVTWCSSPQSLSPYYWTTKPFVFLTVQRKGKVLRCDIHSLDNYEALVTETIVLEI